MTLAITSVLLLVTRIKRHVAYSVACGLRSLMFWVESGVLYMYISNYLGKTNEPNRQIELASSIQSKSRALLCSLQLVRSVMLIFHRWSMSPCALLGWKSAAVLIRDHSPNLMHRVTCFDAVCSPCFLALPIVPAPSA